MASTIAGSTTNYEWDRASSLPLLIDDGTQGYVQTDQGLLEQLGCIASYPLRLIQMLHSGTPRGREAAAELLGSIGDTTARVELERAAQNEQDETVRIYVKRSLDELTSLAGA